MNSMCVLENVEDIDAVLKEYEPSKSSKKSLKKPGVASIASLQASLTSLSIESDGIPITEIPHTKESLGEWKFHSQFVPEDTSLLFVNFEEKKRPDTSTYEKRKKHFSDPKRRAAVTFDPSHVYCMDFYDAYVDFNAFAIKMPGFSLSAFKYWDGQPLRFAAKTRDGQVLFVVNFGLVERPVETNNDQDQQEVEQETE